jgi:hypothetical protein
MKRPLLSSPLFWLASVSVAVAIGFGCSSSSSGPTTTTGPDGSTGGADTGGGADAGGGGDGAHDGPAPDALYGACAVKGSFGWPCSAADSGPDPTDCTDPNFPDCFVGGQGSWCTSSCTVLADCSTDAGCVITGCNSKRYCK